LRDAIEWADGQRFILRGHEICAGMKIATFNVNGVNGRIDTLLRWLDEARPDVVCLQELKAPQEKFPHRALDKAGYGAVWHGQQRWNGVAILARDVEPIETRRGLGGDPDDSHSRYIEAAVNGVLIGCLYAPNGNPAPGSKFDYKLSWYERFLAHTQHLLKTGAPVVLAGDYNIMPTDLDVYAPERWQDDALFRPEVREVFRNLIAQGWMDAGTPGVAMPASASTTCCSARPLRAVWTRPASTATCAAGTMPATTRRYGLHFWMSEEPARMRRSAPAMGQRAARLSRRPSRCNR
jgi:exodeoxyribonuclease III